MNPEAMLEELFGSLEGMKQLPDASLFPKDSNEVLLNKLINDHIYGLLSLDSLTSQQVALLQALLQTKR